MSSLLEPFLDASASNDEYNVYWLRQPRSGVALANRSSAVYPPLYLPRRYSELSFTALGRDARSLLFSAYDSVTGDYVVVELVRTVDAVGGAWLLENRDLVALLLRARLGGTRCHPTLVRTLDLWTPATDVSELRSFAVSYECGGQQLGYYLAPYVLFGHTMPHWRLSNMLYQLVWAAHRVHVGCGSRVRLCRAWDVPITCFLYDEDSCAVKLDVRSLVTTISAAAAADCATTAAQGRRPGNRTSARSSSSSGGGNDGCPDSDVCSDRVRRPLTPASSAVAGLGRMLIRHLAAAAFGTLDVGARGLSAPETLLDRLLCDVLRFTCGAGGVATASGGHERLSDYWAASTAAARLESPDCQLTLLKDFLLMLLRGAAAADVCKGGAVERIDDAFERTLAHPYVSVWREEGDLACDEGDLNMGDRLAADLELLVQRSSGGSSGGGPSSSDSSAVFDQFATRDADSMPAVVAPGSGDGGPTETASAAAATATTYVDDAAADWELPLHALMTSEARYVILREIKWFELTHPHRVRPLSELCMDSLALGGRSTGPRQPPLCEAMVRLLPPQLANRLRDAARRFYPAE